MFFLLVWYLGVSICVVTTGFPVLHPVSVGPRPFMKQTSLKFSVVRKLIVERDVKELAQAFCYEVRGGV